MNSSEYELWQMVIDDGLSVDMGMTSGGPFADDGRVRIYDPDTNNILAEGDDIHTAVESYQLTWGM